MRFRLIPPLDTYPRCVRVAQTVMGKVSLLATCALGLVLLRNPSWWEITGFLALTTFLPRQRRVWLTIGALYLLVFHTNWPSATRIQAVVQREQVSSILHSQAFQILGAVTLLGLLGVLAHLASEYRKSFVLKRPVLALGLLYFLLVLTASYAPVSGSGRVVLWGIVHFLGLYFWYFGYTLLDRNSKDRDPYLLQVGTYYPFWVLPGASPTPFVKGAAYLRKIEAKSPEQLAVTQLKGLKLLYWVLVLEILNALLTRSFFGPANANDSLAVNTLLRWTGWAPPHLSVPTLSTAMARDAAGEPFAWYVYWVTLIASFLSDLLTISVRGNAIVACCRAAGFGALRNTYRPLESRTIADFFNRYYYYFKELLVEFFFYPTFLRYLKGHRRLRLVVATLAAATFGNMLYHFMRDIDHVRQLGLWQAVVGFRVYAFYALVLGVGIAVSQVKERRDDPRRHGWLRGRLWPSLCVGLFFCLLQVFDSTQSAISLRERFVFIAHLFPVGR